MKKIELGFIFLVLAYCLSAQPNIYTDGKIAINNDTPVYDLDIYSLNAAPGIIISRRQ